MTKATNKTHQHVSITKEPDAVARRCLATRTRAHFDVLDAHCNYPGDFLRLLDLVADVINRADDDDAGAHNDWRFLSFTLYQSERCGYILDIDDCVGGPSVWLRYESRNGCADIYAYWGSDSLHVSVTHGDLLDLLSEIGESLGGEE